MKSSEIYKLTKETDSSLSDFGVYAIKSNISNQYYIGSTTKSFRDRWILHYCQLINRTHYNNKLQNGFFS